MSSYSFTDQENRPAFVPGGDYVVEVLDYETGLTKKGDNKIDLKMRVESTGTIFFETLTFLPTLGWKLDTFCKSMAIAPVKGQVVNFDPDPYVVRPGELRVALRGLRGWATLFIDEYPAGSGKKKNKVATWITNKEKLPRALPEPVPAGAPDDDVPF